MILFTVTRLTEEGDTIPFATAYRTQEAAEDAAIAHAESLGINAVIGDEPNFAASSVISAPDDEGNYTEEWLIARVTLQ